MNTVSYALTPYQRARSVQEEEFLGKAIRKFRDRRQAKKDDRHAKKMEKIMARQNAKTERTGIRAGGGGGFGQGLLNLGQQILGGGAAQTMPAPSMDPDYDAPAAQPKDNTKMLVIGGIVLLVLVVGAVMVMRKK